MSTLLLIIIIIILACVCCLSIDSVAMQGLILYICLKTIWLLHPNVVAGFFLCFQAIIFCSQQGIVLSLGLMVFSFSYIHIAWVIPIFWFGLDLICDAAAMSWIEL